MAVTFLSLSFPILAISVHSFVIKMSLATALNDSPTLRLSTTKPNPNPSEVNDWRWIARNDLLLEVEKTPEIFTTWFKIALPKVIQFLKH